MTPGSGAWLAALCASRVLAATWFVAYSAVLPLTQAEWNLSGKEAGLVQSAFHLGYLSSLFIVGFVADHFGAKRAYIVTGAAACASPWAFVLFADGFWSAFWLHAFTGLCQGGTYTPALALINDNVERARRGRAMGLLIAGSSAGYAICLGVAGLALEFTGWRGALAAVAVLPVISWVSGVLLLRGTPNLVHARPAGESLLASVPAVLKSRKGMLSIWAYSFHNWELLGVWAWLPAFLSAALLLQGASVENALLFAALTYIANIGRFDPRRHHGRPLGPHPDDHALVLREPRAFLHDRLADRGSGRGSRRGCLPVQPRSHRRFFHALHRARRERAAALPRRRVRGALRDRLRRGRGEPVRLRLGARRLGRLLGTRLGYPRPGRLARPGSHLETSKPFAEACERNRGPILAVLKRIFRDRRAVLEIGSGTGQHAAYFAPELPHLSWQASDVAEHLPGIRMWGVEPIELDVDKPWPALDADAVFSANTAHILSWPQVERMFAGVARTLPPSGLFALYGPFHYRGDPTSESNARFDAALRARDAASGVRNFEDIEQLARRSGLSLLEDNPMPANNRLLVFKK